MGTSTSLPVPAAHRLRQSLGPPALVPPSQVWGEAPAGVSEGLHSS